MVGRGHYLHGNQSHRSGQSAACRWPPRRRQRHRIRRAGHGHPRCAARRQRWATPPGLPDQRARRNPACRPPRRSAGPIARPRRTPVRRRQQHPLPVLRQPRRPLPARRPRRRCARCQCPEQGTAMKRALVTGGSGGIGAAICRRLATDGHHVIVHANRSLDKAEAVVATIRQAGGSAEAVTFDVTDRTATAAALEKLLESGAIQILVNNAGIHADAVFPGMSGAQWDSVLDVSLNGFFNVTQPLTMPMIRTRWGRIITISSIAGITGNRGQVNYSAAKGALHAASKPLALELASRGITGNAVAPGIIATDMIEGSFDADTIKKLVPMQRAGKPEEVASLIAFLASEQSAYVSGQASSVNGAMV